MSAYKDSSEHYSVCLASVEDSLAGIPFYKWHRIADYSPRDGHMLKPALIESDFRTAAEKKAHPNYLYNPVVAAGFDKRASDVYYFRWNQDPYDSAKTLCYQLEVNQLLPRGCEAKEVIIPNNVNGQADLRAATAEGIPFQGKTSRIFYLVFEQSGSDYFAVTCRAKDFDFSDGHMRLRPKVSNLRADLSASVVQLEWKNIIVAKQSNVSGRMIYADTGDLPEVTRIPMRQLTEYAAEYVGWFARTENRGLSRSDRQKISAVIEEAMSRPDALEEYARAHVSESEVRTFFGAVSSYAKGEDDQVRIRIRDELLKDEEFVALCCEEALRRNRDLIFEKEQELVTLTTEIENAKETLSSSQERVNAAWEELEEVEESVNAQRSELEKLVAQRDELLDEYETNISLRLGLKAVAGAQPPSTASSVRMEGCPCITVRQGMVVEDAKEINSPIEALKKNLGILGVRTFQQVPHEVFDQLAVSVVSALSATRFLAIPSPVAECVADALSIALYGRKATRAYVPTECRDASGFSKAFEGDPSVTVVENVIDAVNEGMLIALMDDTGDTPIILSFTSHASADLLAKEVWDRVFFPASEALVVMPQARRNAKFHRTSKSIPVFTPDVDDVFQQMADISRDLGDVPYTSASLVLPATVLEVAYELVELEFSAVTQHLALALSGTEVIEALVQAQDSDFGLTQMARRLGRG